MFTVIFIAELSGINFGTSNPEITNSNPLYLFNLLLVPSASEDAWNSLITILSSATFGKAVARLCKSGKMMREASAIRIHGQGRSAGRNRHIEQVHDRRTPSRASKVPPAEADDCAETPARVLQGHGVIP